MQVLQCPGQALALLSLARTPACVTRQVRQSESRHPQANSVILAFAARVWRIVGRDARRTRRRDARATGGDIFRIRPARNIALRIALANRRQGSYKRP